MNELSAQRSPESRCFQLIVRASMPFLTWAAYRAARMTMSDACRVTKRTHNPLRSR